jgi:hypothetical protein
MPESIASTNELSRAIKELESETRARRIPARRQDGDLDAHELPPQVDTEELKRRGTESVRAAFDFTIHQLECLRNQIDSDIAVMTAKRDAVDCAFSQFIECATSIVAKIEPRKQALVKLKGSSPI